jgi:hypothetical protein
VRLAWLLVACACHFGGAPPPPPSCADAAEQVQALLAPRPRAAPTRDAFARRCLADGWSAEVRSCVVATRSLRHPRRCKAKLTASQRTALDRELALIDAATQAPALQACSDYGALVERLASCRGIAPAARAALEQGYREITEQVVRARNRSPALEAQCRSMLDSLRLAAAPLCGL